MRIAQTPQEADSDFEVPCSGRSHEGTLNPHEKSWDNLGPRLLLERNLIHQKGADRVGSSLSGTHQISSLQKENVVRHEPHYLCSSCQSECQR